MKKNKDKKKAKGSKNNIKGKELKNLSENGLNREKNKKNKKEKDKEKEKEKEKHKARKKETAKAKKSEVKKDKKKKAKVKKPLQTVALLTPEKIESLPVIGEELVSPAKSSSVKVNVRTATSIIRGLKTVKSVNEYIKGDERITVKKAGLVKIASLSAN